MEQLQPCNTCLCLKPAADFRDTASGTWDTSCAACRGVVRAGKRPMTEVAERGPSASPADDAADAAQTSQVAAVMRLGLFQAALRGASPEAARALMQQLLAAQQAGSLDVEAVADVALAYLELRAPVPPLRLPSAARDGSEGCEEEEAAAAAAAAALDAVPPAVLSSVVDAPAERCRRQLCTLARRSPPLLGQLLSVADPRRLLADGLLASEDLLEALQRPPGSAGLPALAAVAAAAALLAAAPPGPSPQLLSLVRVLAESHLLLAIVEAGHLAPAALRGALEAADGPAFTDIFRAMCSSDAAGQSFLKQCMQRAMPRADYGELMRISMLAEVAQTAQTVTDRATLLGLLEKAFE